MFNRYSRQGRTGTPGHRENRRRTPQNILENGRSLQAKIMLKHTLFVKKPICKNPSTKQHNDLGPISESSRIFIWYQHASGSRIQIQNFINYQLSIIKTSVQLRSFYDTNLLYFIKIYALFLVFTFVINK